MPREAVGAQPRGQRLAVGKKNLLGLPAEIYEDFRSYKLFPGQWLMTANRDPRNNTTAPSYFLLPVITVSSCYFHPPK